MWNRNQPPKDRRFIAITVTGDICVGKWDQLRSYWRRDDPGLCLAGNRLLGIVFWTELPSDYDALDRSALAAM